MNERIKELAEQSYVEVPHERDWDATSKIFDKEKFAELIVKECLALLNGEKEYYSNPGKYESLEYYERMKAKAEALEDAGSLIKSHFGVKQ